MPRLFHVLLGLLVLAPASAAGAAPRDVQVPVRGDATVRAPDRFHLAGLRWSGGPRDVEARIRARRRGGRWTRWVEVHASGHGAARVTEPAWTGAADLLQVRTERRVRGLRAHLVSVPRSRQGATRPRARAAARRRAGAGTPPRIVPREQWAGDQCEPRAVPEYGRVQLAFVHHTVSANDYAPEESARMVLGMCRYHRNAYGWNDLGYNFVVDQYGQVFEGRAGGVDRAVIGAQAQGYNAESTGIASLGTHSDIPATEPAVRAIADLIAWKLPLHGARTAGDVTVISAGGSANRYPAGTPVTLPRIAGHRDGNRTECPGTQLYAQLPRIRELVGDRGPAQAPTRAATTLTAAPAAARLTYPEDTLVTGRLTRADGASVPGAPVRVEYEGSDGVFRELARASTSSDGAWAVTVRSAYSRRLRAVYPGDGAQEASASPPFAVAVAPRLGLRAVRRRIPAGRRADLRGTVRPYKRSLRLVVRRRARAGRYVAHRTVRPRIRRGAWRVALPMFRPGLYRFEARFAGDRRNAAARSRQVFVRITRTAATAVGAASG